MENFQESLHEQRDFGEAEKALFAAWITSVYLFPCGT